MAFVVRAIRDRMGPVPDDEPDLPNLNKFRMDPGFIDRVPQSSNVIDRRFDPAERQKDAEFLELEKDKDENMRAYLDAKYNDHKVSAETVKKLEQRWYGSLSEIHKKFPVDPETKKFTEEFLNGPTSEQMKNKLSQDVGITADLERLKKKKIYTRRLRYEDD